ncbi:MAG TPA: ABC transporter permease [Candidatus Limnocylindria bacterium]|jgi:ABC-2 type transport system permease protein|nr:ABC transporter permease [Candidatus Limnocylindria bacterium]
MSRHLPTRADLMADLRAFGAAGMKEWRLLRRYPSMFLGFLFWPIALPLAYVYQAQAYSGGQQAASDAFAARAGTTEVAAFLFLGWAAYMWISMILWGPGTSLRNEQVRGSLEALFMTPVSRLVILFGPVVSQVVWAIWMFAVVGGALTLFFGFRLSVLEAMRALGIILVAVPALYGLGALFAAVVLRFGEVGALVQTVRGIFTVFCGMTFPIIILPEWARGVALALPPTYLIGDLRQVLLAGADLASLIPELAVLLTLGIGLCGLAVVAFRRTERYARRGGSLAQY